MDDSDNPVRPSKYLACWTKPFELELQSKAKIFVMALDYWNVLAGRATRRCGALFIGASHTGYKLVESRLWDNLQTRSQWIWGL